MIPLKTLGRWLRPGLLLSLLVMLTGCDAVAILSPKGQIGQDEKTLLITATVLMLLVVIPVIIMTLTFAWKYRASNTKARYEPKWSHSTAIEVVVWSIPCMIVLVLAVLATQRRLAPALVLLVLVWVLVTSLVSHEPPARTQVLSRPFHLRS